MTTEYTDNFRLALPDFRMGPWHDLVNEDFVTIDQLIYNLYQGVDTTIWANNTAYTAGDTAVDSADESYWVCCVSHTSAVTGTFAQDRAANPGRWNRVLVGLSPRGEWAHSTNYLPNDLVSASPQGIIAVCITAHTSNASGTILDDSVNWSFLVHMAGTFAASSVTYNHATSGTTKTNIQDTTDELYAFHASQQTTINGNTSNIATNTANIATNTANIATNTANIASNTSAIATKVPDAPNDGKLYGRKSAAWADTGGVYVAKSGDIMTGVLVLYADPANPLEAATKQYVDAHAGSGGGGIPDAPSDGSYYGRLNATWAKVAPIASPTFTGVPAAPTAAPSTNTTQLATTAFVATAVGAVPAPPAPATATPLTDTGTGAVGTSVKYAREDHVHPASAGGGASVTISDTAPSSPSPGNLWWESDTGLLYIYYNDGNSSQWVIAAPQPDVSAFVSTNVQSLTPTQQVQALTNIGASPYDAMAGRNILINGAMELDQIFQGSALAFPTGNVGSYTIDMWLLFKSGTMVLSAQQVADAPPGFSNSLKITVTTGEAALAASEYTFVVQRVEGFRSSRLSYGTANALPVVIGFWTKIHRTGIYGGAIRNSGSTRQYTFSFTQNVADTWEYKTVSIPGDVAGTWVGNTNGIGLELCITLASGTNYQAASGAWGSTGAITVPAAVNGVAATTDVFQITGVTLQSGTLIPTAAQSVGMKRPFSEDLILCRRYLWCSKPSAPRGSGMGTLAGYSLNANAIQLTATRFTVPMRAVPVLQIWSLGVQNNVRNSSTGAAIAVTSVTNTYGDLEGWSTIVVGSLTASIWVDYEAIADARL
jgi:hypothetical protein